MADMDWLEDNAWTQQQNRSTHLAWKRGQNVYYVL